MFVQRKDGTLWLLVRTGYGIGESVSTDGGKTWPDVVPSGHPAHSVVVRHSTAGQRPRKATLPVGFGYDDIAEITEPGFVGYAPCKIHQVKTFPDDVVAGVITSSARLRRGF